MYNAITNQDNEIYVTDANEMLTLDALTKKDLDLVLETYAKDSDITDLQNQINNLGDSGITDLQNQINNLGDTYASKLSVINMQEDLDNTLSIAEYARDKANNSSSYDVYISSDDPTKEAGLAPVGRLLYSKKSNRFYWTDNVQNFDFWGNEYNYIWHKIPSDTDMQAQFATKADKQTVSTISATGDVTQELLPNNYYKFTDTSINSLNLTFGSEINSIINEYMFEFIASDTPTTLTLPETVNWIGGVAPTIVAGKTYQVSIVNNLAVYGEF